MKEKLKQLIIKVVPEIRQYENRCYTCGFGFDYCRCKPKKTEWFKDRPITLADVLVAIRKKLGDYDCWITTDGHFYRTITNDEDGNHEIEPTGIYWDLEENYDNQSEEFYDWCYELIN